MARILIKNGRVWDGERFSFTDILTDGDRIVKMEPYLSDDATYTYDATDKTVSAGLVDAHVHMRGVSTDRFGTPIETSSFPFGVTAAADASGEQGDRALLERFMLRNVVFAKAKIQNNRADLCKTEERLRVFEDRAVGIKVYFDTTISEVVDTAPLRQICEFAHARGLRVMVHSSHAPVPMSALLQTLRVGDILTHSFHGGIHNASEDDFESMREAQARGVVIDVGFAGHVHTDFAILRQAIEQGALPDVISTDITKLSAYTRGGRYGMTMCMSIAKQLGMREEDIFKAVTANPARALGKADEWGCLRVGRKADLAVFDETNEGYDLTDKAGHRVSSRFGYRCVLTLCDGQVVYRNG
ncbi:MAG: hypothetical protein E7666_08275 [Ruminococcaceae bacterium]|nr:hypothetical protein [Oscillospiraceae bacterium]